MPAVCRTLGEPSVAGATPLCHYASLLAGEVGASLLCRSVQLRQLRRAGTLQLQVGQEPGWLPKKACIGGRWQVSG